MLKFVALLVAVLACRSEGGMICSFPGKFEGQMRTERVSFFPNQKPVLVKEEVRFGYDADSERSYQHFRHVNADKTEEEVLTWAFSKLNLTYTVANGTCTKGSSGPWIKLGVPDDAISTGTYYVGEDRRALITDYKLPGGAGLDTTMILSVNADCIPVAMKQLALFAKGGFASLMTFQNITLGIGAECVFKVPDICLKAVPEVEVQDRGFVGIF